MKVHYKSFEGLSKRLSPPVQIFCKRLVSEGISGKLEIYPDSDINFEKQPDVIYPSIRNAANHANARYLQRHVDYDEIVLPARVVACIYEKRTREAYNASYGHSNTKKGYT